MKEKRLEMVEETDDGANCSIRPAKTGNFQRAISLGGEFSRRVD